MPFALGIFIYLFPPYFNGRNCDSVLPHRRLPALALPQLYPIAEAEFGLVVVSLHPAESIEYQGHILLSIFSFQFAAKNDEQMSSPFIPTICVSASNPPIPSADPQLVVVSPYPLKAIKNQGPVSLSLFLYFPKLCTVPMQGALHQPPPWLP